MSHFLGSSRATYSKQSLSGKFNGQATTTAAAFMRSYKNAASTMVGTSAGGSQQDDEMKSNHDILEINLGDGDFSPSEVAFTDMDSADTQECNFVDLSCAIPIK
jgi:hypothetical protein